jgi:hypothetical protein
MKKVYNLLNEAGTNLRLTVVFLSIYFTSIILENLVIPFWYIIDLGPEYLSEFSQFFDFNSLMSILALLALYITVSNFGLEELVDKNKYLSSAIIIVFFLHYFFTFHFVERLLSLYPFSINQLPISFTDFFPFDWVGITGDFGTISDGYAGWEHYLSIVFNCVSAVSILAAVILFLRHLKSSSESIGVKTFIKSLRKDYITKWRLTVGVIVTIPFLLINSMNVQAFDYRVLSYEAEFTQEVLVEFYKEFTDADSLGFIQLANAKKEAANKAYPEVVAKKSRIQSIDNSLLSSDFDELKEELVEWVDLWLALLQQIALESGGDKETLFKITQKYIEVSRIALQNAPSLADQFQLDFWETDFLTLTK